MSHIGQIKLLFFVLELGKPFSTYGLLLDSWLFHKLRSKPYIFRCSQVPTLFICQRLGVEFTHLFNNITIASGWEMLKTVGVLDFYLCFYVLSSDSICKMHIQTAVHSTPVHSTVKVYFLLDLLGIFWSLIIMDLRTSCSWCQHISIGFRHGYLNSYLHPRQVSSLPNLP